MFLFVTGQMMVTACRGVGGIDGDDMMSGGRIEMEMRQDYRNLIVQQADAANPAITSLLHAGRHWRRVADPFRSAAS